MKTMTYFYNITFQDGRKLRIRARSPKEAYELGSKQGIVSFIKWVG